MNCFTKLAYSGPLNHLQPERCKTLQNKILMENFFSLFVFKEVSIIWIFLITLVKLEDMVFNY